MLHHLRPHIESGATAVHTNHATEQRVILQLRVSQARSTNHHSNLRVVSAGNTSLVLIVKHEESCPTSTRSLTFTAAASPPQSSVHCWGDVRWRQGVMALLPSSCLAVSLRVLSFLRDRIEFVVMGVVHCWTAQNPAIASKTTNLKQFVSCEVGFEMMLSVLTHQIFNHVGKVVPCCLCRLGGFRWFPISGFFMWNPKVHRHHLRLFLWSHGHTVRSVSFQCLHRTDQLAHQKSHLMHQNWPFVVHEPNGQSTSIRLESLSVLALREMRKMSLG